MCGKVVLYMSFSWFQLKEGGITLVYLLHNVTRNLLSSRGFVSTLEILPEYTRIIQTMTTEFVFYTSFSFDDFVLTSRTSTTKDNHIDFTFLVCKVLRHIYFGIGWEIKRFCTISFPDCYKTTFNKLSISSVKNIITNNHVMN